jgi:hypothetical protein
MLAPFVHEPYAPLGTRSPSSVVPVRDQEALVRVIVALFAGYRGSAASTHVQEFVHAMYPALYDEVVTRQYHSSWLAFLRASSCALGLARVRGGGGWRVHLANAPRWWEFDAERRRIQNRRMCHRAAATVAILGGAVPLGELRDRLSVGISLHCLHHVLLDDAHRRFLIDQPVWVVRLNPHAAAADPRDTA